MTEINLPKWPQILIRGKDVSVEQALEIIRRTDIFFDFPDYCGNDRLFNKYLMNLLNIPEALEYRPFWRQKWGCIETENFICNSWIVSSSLQGPNGWCSPEGKIEYAYNVASKWPTVEELFLNFEKIAEAFPFLEFGVVVMDQEYSSMLPKNPLVSFLIKAGEVTQVPATLDVLTPYGGPIEPVPTHVHFQKVVANSITDREKGLAKEVLEKFENKAKELGLK